MTAEIQNLTDMINEANVTEIKIAGQEKIDSIPDMINQFTEKEIENLAQPMEEIRIQFSDIIGQIGMSFGKIHTRKNYTRYGIIFFENAKKLIWLI